MKKISFSLIILLSCSLASYAQVSIVPKAGVNFATVSFDEDVWEDREALTGFTAGVGLNYKLSGEDFLSIQPELLYSQKGFSAQSSALGFNYNGDYRLNYLELPVLLKINFGTETFALYVNGGPSIGYLLGGRVKGSGSFLGVVGGDLDEKIDFDDNPTVGDISELDANRLEFGLNFGGGVGYNFSENSTLFADIRYNLGLTDFDNNQQSKNRVIALTAGVKLPF